VDALAKIDTPGKYENKFSIAILGGGESLGPVTGVDPVRIDDYFSGGDPAIFKCRLNEIASDHQLVGQGVGFFIPAGPRFTIIDNVGETQALVFPFLHLMELAHVADRHVENSWYTKMLTSPKKPVIVFQIAPSEACACGEPLGT
jgi:hypothetical protein